MSASIIPSDDRTPRLGDLNAWILDEGAAGIRVGTPHQLRWLNGIVVAILFLNLADALFTLHWITTGQATEANPVLWLLAHHHPAWFVVAKTALVGLGSWLLLRLRSRALAVLAIFTAFMAYYLVFLYHLHAFDVQLIAQLTR